MFNSAAGIVVEFSPQSQKRYKTLGHHCEDTSCTVRIHNQCQDADIL
jgi:hypothetical protein